MSEMSSMGLILWNILTPKFYVALTASSFFISILILLFEWWYYAKYGVSFLEQFSLNYLTPLLGTNGPHGGDVCEEQVLSADARHSLPGNLSCKECKVWKNPMSLLRGSEYRQFWLATGKEPLTFYDMNLTAQDHQNLFTCDWDASREDMRIMSAAWRERDPDTRAKSAHMALERNAECATAYMLLAEEEAPSIGEAERLLALGLKAAESAYRKSQLAYHQNVSHEALHRRDLNVLVYMRRRLAMCLRKTGKVREAVKMMRDLIKDFPLITSFNIHENLIEALLEMRAYADVQALLAKYDDINLPKSATICYTSALLKARSIGDKFSPDLVMKRGLSMGEMHAVEAICRAVEFNPHVPKYLLEAKKLLLPPEHFLKRGDSEAVSYAFFHLPHWKQVEGALNLLECTWKSTFNMIPYPLEKGHLFYPYPTCTESTDRELLPEFHDLSVYPQKNYPFFIRFTASFCILTACTAFITHQYPEFMFQSGRMLINTSFDAMMYFVEKFDFFLPAWLYQQFLPNY